MEDTKKMKIVVNNKNEITSVSYVGPLDNSIELDFEDLGDLEDKKGYLKYSYIDKKIVVNDNKNKLDLVALRDLRVKRKHLLQAFDVYKTNVIYGIEIETNNQKEEVLQWYNNLLDLKGDAFDSVPSCIERYL